MRRTLRLRMMLIVCGVSALSTTLALALHDRSLSRDLGQAAQARLERGARAASRLAESHLAAMAARYQAISGTPQLRAALEVGHAATLAHYAETLRERQGAARIAFLDATGSVVAGAGDAALDAAALGAEAAGLVVHDGRPYAVASADLGPGEEPRGRLVGIEPLRDATLAEWSGFCDGELSFAASGAPRQGALEAVARRFGGFELRVAASLDAERSALRSARWNLLVAGLIALGAALAAGRVASRSVVQPILRLQAAAERIGGGDLSARVGIDRDDEIGDVARAFDEMAADLRSTLGHVAEAADRLEGTAGHVATLCEGVAQATADQVRESGRAGESMSLVKRQLAQLGISAGDSLRTLNEAVDGSSLSFRELGKTGEELSRNADRLVTRVVETARSIDETLASARDVSRSTESLTDAAEETSRSMEQMAGAMREADLHLGETTALSRHVLEAAESGRAKVRETTESLQTIQAASAAAEETIRELATHAEGIGEIVDVIDGVAEDSGLLALNAAIIAAQAGGRWREARTASVAGSGSPPRPARRSTRSPMRPARARRARRRSSEALRRTPPR